MDPALYLAQVSLYAAILWGIYCAVWRNQPLHTYSRVYLLVSLVLPVVLPLIRIPLVAVSPAAAGYSIALPGVRIAGAQGAREAAGVPLMEMVGWLYAGGAALVAAVYIRAYARIRGRLRSGQPVVYNGHTVFTHTGAGPGTLGRTIFFPAGDVDPVIVRHETAHIEAGHRYDCLLLQLLHVIFWVSPAHWIIGRELKMVHEFEADRRATAGVGAAGYASLLLSHSLGAPHLFAVAHSFFHHPLKRRIAMLQKTVSPGKSLLLTTTLLLTLGFASAALVAQAKKTSKTGSAAAAPDTRDGVEKMDDIVKSRRPIGEVRMLDGLSFAFRTVEKAPEFRGEMYRWIAQNLRYPALSRGLRQEGVCTVQFTVTENGQITGARVQRSAGYIALDEEALRIVNSMPAWKPGVQNGKVVPVSVSLPVYFSLLEGGC